MRKKKFSPLWLIPAVVIVMLILWCIHFPLTMFMGLDKDAALSDVEIMVDEVGDPMQDGFHTSEAEVMTQVVEEVRNTRGRFFGWYGYINYTDEPLLVLSLWGRDDHGLFVEWITVDNQGNIYLSNGTGGIRVRAKDSALYDYLTELVQSQAE